MRVLVGGVGYRDLCDHSFGPLLVDELLKRAWPDSLSIEDVSYNPIAFVQRIEDDAAERRFTRAVIVSAAERGRAAGALSAYRWDGALPDTNRIQAAVAEAVTGVIALDNTLIVAKYFGALPREVVVVEVEPANHAFGHELSADVAIAFERARNLVPRLALDADLPRSLPEASLGGGALTPARTSPVRISHVGPR